MKGFVRLTVSGGNGELFVKPDCIVAVRISGVSADSPPKVSVSVSGVEYGVDESLDVIEAMLDGQT